MIKLACFKLNQEVRSQGGKCVDREGEQEQLLLVTLLTSGNKSAVSYVQRLTLGFFFPRIFLQNFTAKLKMKRLTYIEHISVITPYLMLLSILFDMN
jgi:hypothetical protein